MKKLLPIISSCDTYGTLFNFTINRELKFKTLLGGIISILTFLFIVYTTFLFGKDFFFRTNPKIVFMQEDFESDSNQVKISNKNLIIAWRIEDSNRKQVVYPNDLIYSTITYFSYFYSTEKNQTENISKNIPIMKCNEILSSGVNVDLTFDHDFNHFNASEWNCVDFDSVKDLYLGGFAEENTAFQRFEVSFNACENELLKQEKASVVLRNNLDYSNEEPDHEVKNINRNYFKSSSFEFSSNKFDNDFKYENDSLSNNNLSISIQNKNNHNESIENSQEQKLNKTLQKSIAADFTNIYLSKPKCSDISKLKSFLSETKYISIIYPKAHYSFTNLKDPFTIIHKNYLTNLNLNLVKKDEFISSMETLIDDISWIFRTMQNYSGLSVNEIKNSLFFQVDSEYNKNKPFYSFSFHLQRCHFKYFRSFMKFQDLAAIVGGFVKIVQIVLNAFYLNYNIFSRDKFLINYLFENGKVNEDSNESSNKSNFHRKSFLILNNNTNNYPNASNFADPLQKKSKRLSTFNSTTKNKKGVNPNINGDKSQIPRRSINPNLSKIFDNFSIKPMVNPIKRLKTNSVFFNGNKSSNFNSNTNYDNSSHNNFLNINNIQNNFFNENLQFNINDHSISPLANKNFILSNNNKIYNLPSLKNQDVNSQHNDTNIDNKIHIFSDDKGNVIENKLKNFNVISEIEFKKLNSIKSFMSNREKENKNKQKIEVDEDNNQNILQDILIDNNADINIKKDQSNKDLDCYQDDVNHNKVNPSDNHDTIDNNKNFGFHKEPIKLNSVNSFKDRKKLTIDGENVPHLNSLDNGSSFLNNIYKTKKNSDNNFNNIDKEKIYNALNNQKDLYIEDDKNVKFTEKKHNNYFLNQTKTDLHLEDLTYQTKKFKTKVNFRLSESISHNDYYNNHKNLLNKNHNINSSLNPFTLKHTNKELLGSSSNNNTYNLQNIDATNNINLNYNPKHFKLEFSSFRFQNRYSRNAKSLNKSYFNYCCKKICRRNLTREEERKIFIFEYAREYISKKLDLFKYLKNLSYLNIILELIANQNQKTALKYLSQPCIVTENFDIVKRRGTMKTPVERHNGMIDYFKDACENDNLTQLDGKILDLLNKKFSKM